MTRVLTGCNLKHLVSGATILGTGGGGDPRTGLRTLLSDLESGKKVKLVKANELAPHSMVVCAYFCGWMRAPGRKNRGEKQLMNNGRFMKLALRTLERKLKRRISAVIPTEIGGGNTAVAVHVAAISGLPVIDGDQTGRSAPELIHSSYHLKGIRATPSVIVDSSGKMIVIENCRNNADYERMVRDFAVRAGGTVFAVDSPLEAKKIQSCAIMNSVSKAMKLAEVLEKARVKKGDPVQATVSFLKGFRLFDGFVQDFNLAEKKGFLVGEMRLKGRCIWKGHSFRVWVKNENIIGRRDEKVVVTAPDLICVLDEDGNGVTNSELRRGMKATVIGVRANRIWRTKRGIELFGPRHFGFDFDYMPVEKLFR